MDIDFGFSTYRYRGRILIGHVYLEPRDQKRIGEIDQQTNGGIYQGPDKVALKGRE
jgi:hypothetical protein